MSWPLSWSSLAQSCLLIQRLLVGQGKQRCRTFQIIEFLFYQFIISSLHSVSREDVSSGGYYDMTCKCGPHGWWSITTASCYVQRFKDSAYEEEMYHQQYSCKKCCQDEYLDRRRRERFDRAYNRAQAERERQREQHRQQRLRDRTSTTQATTFT